jgi:rhodanese-related sulfurtransferase
MKTIDPKELESLLEASKPVEILDLRPRDEFEKVHVEGARSVRMRELTPEMLIGLRELPLTEPLYLISDSENLAWAAAENLERQGWDNAVVVEGGIKACERDGLRVERRHTIADWLVGHSTHLAAMGFAPEWR